MISVVKAFSSNTIDSKLFKSKEVGTDDYLYQEIQFVAATTKIVQDSNILLNVIMTSAPRDRIDSCLLNQKPILILAGKSYKQMNSYERKVFTDLLNSKRCIAVWVYDDFENSTKEFVEFHNKLDNIEIYYRNMIGSYSYDKPFGSKFGYNNNIAIEGVFEENKLNFTKTKEALKGKFHITDEVTDKTSLILSVVPEANTDKALAYYEEGILFRSMLPKNFYPARYVDSRIFITPLAASYFNRPMPLNNDEIKGAEELISECEQVYKSFNDMPLAGAKKSSLIDLEHDIFHFIMMMDLNK